MRPVASPLTTTCARAAPVTPALRALRPLHVSPFSCHSSRGGPRSTAGILLWRAHACQGNTTIARVSSRATDAAKRGSGGLYRLDDALVAGAAAEHRGEALTD